MDLHLGVDLDGLTEGLTVALDVQNIADEDPPFVNLSGGYDPQTASPIGRLIALSLRMSW